MGIIYKNGIAYGNQPSIDATLTHQGEAADAKAVGDAVSELRNTLDHKADAIYDTASGDIASFPDGADGLPVKDLTVAIEPVQSGTGDPSPTNVRTISGRTGCNVTRTGKNLLPPISETSYKGVTYTQVADWIVLNGTPTTTSYKELFNDYLGPGTYTLNGVSGGSNDKYRTGYSTSSDGTTWSSWVYNSTANNTFTLSERILTRIWLFVYTGVGTLTNLKLQYQLESGSTATSYATYTGTTIPISWQSEAGTVYRGNINPIIGVLTATMARTQVKDLSWSLYNTVFYASLATKIPVGDEHLLISEEYKPCPSEANVGSGGQWENNTIRGSTSGSYCYIKDTRYATAADFKNAETGQGNSWLYYELAEPIVYQLDHVTVPTLLGQNHIWADCGPSTVEYQADTKLYIQKINTPTDDDMIADANIASGKYFIVNNNLYLSTAAILAGDPIKPGTNCTLTNLAAALNAINS